MKCVARRDYKSISLPKEEHSVFFRRNHKIENNIETTIGEHKNKHKTHFSLLVFCFSFHFNSTKDIQYDGMKETIPISTMKFHTNFSLLLNLPFFPS
jgi:hypothetical protein